MYFKISFLHDLMAKNPEERKRITGIQILSGFHCQISYKCPHREKCKYKNFISHNLSSSIKNWIYFHLNIKIPYTFYIQKFSTDLSGTSTCPFNMPREETCFRCKFCGPGERCENKERQKLWEEGRHKEYENPENPYACKLFERNDYFDCYNKITGDLDIDAFIDKGMENFKKEK